MILCMYEYNIINNQINTQVMLNELLVKKIKHFLSVVPGESSSP